MTIQSSITDTPRNLSLGHKDSFGISLFENGLVQFIGITNTPITIALQGEWGSGKTSLMYSLNNRLCENQNANFFGIWLNTWEYSLMNDAQTTLLQIILKLIKEVTKIAETSQNQTTKLLNKATQLGRGLMRIGVKIAGDQVIGEGVGSAVADELFSQTGESTILEIRNELENIINQCVTTHGKKGFIFFIDDLDRIDPPTAVNLLELLKNIFTIDNCIFILAVDYDVVVKGLEPKFGKLSETNEREFRSFFDKIIQVPFSMPVGNYQVSNFLQESLTTTGYLNAQQSQDLELMANFAEIANISVGTNPRALKRLLNSLSLIGCINRAKNEHEAINDNIGLLVNFALVSIQIAYPPIYRLLSQFPAFDKWDEAVGLHMQVATLSSDEIAKLSSAMEFDEEWEQILYRYCKNDPYLNRKSLQISRLLNKVRDLVQAENEDIENIIKSVITLANVTSIDATMEQPELDFHVGTLLKTIREQVLKRLQQECPQYQHLQPKGKRVESNAYFTYVDQEQSVGISIWVENKQVKFATWADVWVCPTYDKPMQEILAELNLTEEYNQLFQDYQAFTLRNPSFEFNKFDGNIRRLENWHVFVIEFRCSEKNPQLYNSEVFIAQLTNIYKQWLPLIERLADIGDKVIAVKGR